MLLSFSRVVFLIVHSCLLSIVAAIPVTQTTTAVTQTHETDTKQTRTTVEMNTLKLGIAEYQPSTMESKEITFFEIDEKKDETIKNEKLQSCRVANLTYQHREQIPRSDPCEMCVCVDSEIYCLWKLCTFFNTTTITTTLPTTAVTNSQPTTKQSVYDNKLTSKSPNEEDVKANEIETTNEKYSKILTDRRKHNVLKKLQTTTIAAESGTTSKTLSTTPKSNTSKPLTVTSEPVVCYVMGVMYKYGEVLPRDTGTCLECSCSEGGKVTCSPKDCVSQPDLDYLSHNNNLDMFDLDTF